MSILILGSLPGTLLGWLMGFLSVFLILLVLVQRGRGGGLTGALGGPGGQSAFGSKAGDTFTIITIVVASIWGFTCAFTMWLLGTPAPTATMPTTMKAGPSESEEDTTSGIVIPKPSGPAFDETGLSGIGDASKSSETPSMELKPADPKATETPADKPQGEDAEAAEASKPGEAAESDATANQESTASDDSATQDNAESSESSKPGEDVSETAKEGTSAKSGGD